VQVVVLNSAAGVLQLYHRVGGDDDRFLVVESVEGSLGDEGWCVTVQGKVRPWSDLGLPVVFAIEGLPREEVVDDERR
jgi:hypothetical protein